HRRVRADIAESQHGAAVGDDGNRIALDRQRMRLGRLLPDRFADAGNIRRIDTGQIVAILNRRFGLYRYFASQMKQERAIGDMKQADALYMPKSLRQTFGSALLRYFDGEIANAFVLVRMDDVDSDDVALRSLDRGSGFAELRYVCVDFQ